MTNMGKTDRIIRGVAGLAILALVFVFGLGGAGLMHWILVAVGVVMIATAAIGICPAYLPFGLSTCPRR